MANHTGKGTFQKGDDKRRNKRGQRNAAAVAFTRTLRELIVKEGERSLSVQGEKHKKVEWMVRQLWSVTRVTEYRMTSFR